MLDLRRREFITLIGGAAAVAWPLCARAQEAARQHLIGFVTGLSEAELRPLAGAFRARLQELGWFEGRNVIIDARGTAGDFDRLVTDAAALVSANADVIVAVGTPAGASIALWVQQVETAARARGVTLLIQEARTPDDLAPAFDGLAKQRSQAVIVPANGLFQTERTRIVQLALAARLPTIMAYPQDVEVGGLASYGVDVRENYRRAAAYVDKILKGTKPGDLPIEFPTKLMLAINLKTARALGLEVPLHLQQLADEVIE